VLNPLDDYPVHQTPEPLAHTASSDRNAYDRYFFNGFDADGELFFGAALGVYPNRQVLDASFSVVHGGVQRSVHASGRAPLDRRITGMGPITVEIVEPMRRLRVRVDDAGVGIAAALEFTARTPAVEEPRFTMHDESRVVFDYTRLTQWGRWEGFIEIDGRRHEIEAGRHHGVRDRSWGVRPVGEPPGGAPSHVLPQFFWLWAPLEFDDCCTHFDVNEHADGARWHQTGLVVPLFQPDENPDATFAPETIETMRDVAFEIDWVPGTRRSARAAIELTPWHGDDHRIELEPLLTFPMRGLGYLSPDWGHGNWKGELVIGSDSWDVDSLDPTEPWHLHVQQVVRARWGDRVGVGVFEQLAINDHQPTGLTGLFDGAAG
jgi:hypothetical protein